MGSDPCKKQSLVSVAVPQLVGGGAEKITRIISAELASRNRLNRIYSGGSINSELLSKNIFALKSKRALSALHQFLFAVRSDSADVFFATLGFVNLAPIMRLMKPRAKIVLRLGNTVSPELGQKGPLARLWFIWSIRMAMYFADSIIVQCRFMETDLLKYVPEAASKIRVVYNFISVPDLGSVNQKPIDEPYLFTAITNKPQKAVDVLLKAFSSYRMAGGKRKLVIAGIDPDDRLALKWMREFNLSEQEVYLLGFVDQIGDYIIGSDLCILTSRYEGFSNFLLEAACHGKAIVATDCPGGNREFAECYPNISLTAVDDDQQISKAFHQPRNDLGPHDVSRHLKKFSKEQIIEDYMSILSVDSA